VPAKVASSLLASSELPAERTVKPARFKDRLTNRKNEWVVFHDENGFKRMGNRQSHGIHLQARAQPRRDGLTGVFGSRNKVA
jgi:hypothetical protein